MVWVFITVAAVGLFWLGYRNPYRRRWLLPRQGVPVPVTTTAAVDRQHRHLAAGGRVGDAAVASTAAHFEKLLKAGRHADVERELKPGTAFAVQVRALAAVGTPEAGRVLERQLGRTLARDPAEQAWYWADLAAGLRQLGHLPALPAVLRCADAAAGLPAGTVLAAEAVAFPNFAAALNDLASPSGRAALRAVVAVSKACREGAVEPGGVMAVGLGELLATLSETAAPLPDPWLTAAMLEAQRMHRRVGHWSRLLSPQVRPLIERPGTRLLASSARRIDWLAGAAARLVARFPVAGTEEQAASLRCLSEMRADVSRLFPHLPGRRSPWWAEAIRCLTWSRSPFAGAVLAGHAARWLDSHRNLSRAVHLLAALRGHPDPDAERVLLRGTQSGYPEIRLVAVSSLGWWPPCNPEAVMQALRSHRNDPNEGVRTATVSALARLGERAALGEVLAALHAEEPAIRAGTATRIAAEELSWLWPDLQLVAESGDREVAFAAAEAFEQLREHALGPVG